MGKGSGSQSSTTTVKNELSPEQRQIMQSTMSTYMPDGKLPTASPTFDFNSNPTLQGYADNRVAPFSQDTQDAFNLTRSSVGAQQPTVNAAKGLTAIAGASPIGQKVGLGNGWSTGANGQAQYEDFSSGVNRYMNPYVDQVINSGLDKMRTQWGMTNNSIDDSSIKAGSFGGTRQAVQRSLNDASFGNQAKDFIGSQLSGAFDKASGQYNTGFTQGMSAIGHNQGVDQANASNQLAAGAQLGNLATAGQQINSNDINALSSIGAMQQQQDQTRRDVARSSQLEDSNYGLNVAQAVSGFTPPPTTTQSGTVSSSMGSGAIWGSMLGAAAQALPVMFSDERAKTDVAAAKPDDALARIRKLKPISYDYTDEAKAVGAPDGRRTGFTAQDLEKASGKPSPTMPGGFKGVDMAEHIGTLTHAIQALDERLAKLSKSTKRVA